MDESITAAQIALNRLRNQQIDNLNLMIGSLYSVKFIERLERTFLSPDRTWVSELEKEWKL